MRFFILSAACVATMTCVAAEEKINSVIAIVNNHSISRLEMRRQEDEIRRQSAERGESISGEKVRRQALDTLIFRLLQLQYAKQVGLTVPETMVDDRLNELQAHWKVKNKDEFQQLLSKQLNISMADFRQRVREEIEIEALFFREVFQKIDVYEEEIDNFLRAESGFVQQREYRLRHLLIAADKDEQPATGEDEQPATGENEQPTADKGEQQTAKARELIESLRRRIVTGGESFAALAREYSAADDAANDGDLQWRPAEQLPLPFIAEAQNLSEGEISQIISTQRGFHLLQLTAVRGGEINTTNLNRLHLSHLFLSSDDKQLGKQLYRQLQNGADFSALVKQYSIDDKSADNGGELGWFLPAKLPDYFAPAQRLGEGKVSAPIESPFGVHLVRVNKREQIDLQTMREQARQVLRERRAVVQRLDWLQELRGKAYIIIIDPAYGGLIDSVAG